MNLSQHEKNMEYIDNFRTEKKRLIISNDKKIKHDAITIKIITMIKKLDN